MTTSVPRAARRRPSQSMSTVLPTPGAAPRYTRNRPRAGPFPAGAVAGGAATGGLFSAMPGSSSRGGAELLQGQVQFQHIDPFLADETEGPALDVGVDQVTHPVRWQPMGVRDPVDLQQGVGGADVRV